jgi:hypothetical protein
MLHRGGGRFWRIDQKTCENKETKETQKAEARSSTRAFHTRHLVFVVFSSENEKRMTEKK